MATINLSVDILLFISITLGIVAIVSMVIVTGVIIYIQGSEIIKAVSYLIKHQKLNIGLEDFVWNVAISSLSLVFISMVCIIVRALVLRIHSC